MNLASLSRRDALTLGSSSLLTLALPTFIDSQLSLAAQEKDDSLPPLNRFPRMVHEWFVDRLRQIERKANQRRATLKTKADAQQYVKDVQKKIQLSFGPWPKRTPLKPRITGTVKRDGYRIEKVIFESRPNFYVTANLYVPTDPKPPFPGVVGTCGHSTNGKAAEAYQAFSQGLARQGYIVLIYDPIGQGERLQYPDEHLKSKVGVGVREHLYGGNQQFLVGEFFGSWRAWDGIRALDYLLTRPEVDKSQIGVTGNSGGGTMTTWLCGVERRWTMGAPACFVTTIRRNLENELPQDTEQCPPKILAMGLDHSDFLAAMAPKPIIILAKEKDYFDARGSEESYRRLKHLYKLLGAEENVKLFIGPTYHGYSQENREAMYRFFNHVTKVSDAKREPKLTIEKDERLYCAPKGQVTTLGSRPLYEFTKEKSKQLAQKRTDKIDLKSKIADVLKLTIPDKWPVADYRIIRNRSSRKYPARYAVTYAIETEPDIQAIVYRLSQTRLMSRPPREAKRAILYVSHHSADAELRQEPLIKELLKAEPDSAFYTCDVRGIGESQPDTCGPNSFLQPYGNDYMYAIYSLMLDQPYLGRKTWDVLQVLHWLQAQEHKEIHLVGNGWGALSATFAAVLSESVSQVTLLNALTSYSAIAESETYQWPLSTLLPNVLQSFDLPDCYAHLKAKKLRQIEPLDQNAK